LAKKSSQKFISRNRAPRVQIEYDVEVYGAEKKIQLPFVMGVLADLSGKPADPLEPVADRKVLDIDVDNFDERMKAMKPRVAMQVPNTLTGEGNLNVDITFDSMDDFSPAAVARKVGALSKLLEARTQLANLVTYMDGKTGAEELIARVIKDPALLQSLVGAPNPEAAAPAESAGDDGGEKEPSDG
jgi:type VI secretion system protein ImpB